MRHRYFSFSSLLNNLARLTTGDQWYCQSGVISIVCGRSLREVAQSAPTPDVVWVCPVCAKPKANKENAITGIVSRFIFVYSMFVLLCEKPERARLRHAKLAPQQPAGIG